MSTRTTFLTNNSSLHDSFKSFNLEAVKAAYALDPESVNTVDQIVILQSNKKYAKITHFISL